MRDHPRSRGVYCGRHELVRQGHGSSPLARGLRPLDEEYIAYTRIIPARAGFTQSDAARWRRATDHPRSRGVYIPPHRAMGRDSGSSPLARGLPWYVFPDKFATRIIPARAGFTSHRSFAVRGEWDHPRSRGVYLWCHSRKFMTPGSSPLARGLLVGLGAVLSARGIIPARAGFTRREYWRCSPAWDHPRSRGVYSSSARIAACSRGSSPLARGLHEPRTTERWYGGIIPARAGFTERMRTGQPTCTDHPRSRGVYRIALASRARAGGSSPLARGLLNIRPHVSGRILDHPRSRGVYDREGVARIAGMGSSPLARGLREPFLALGFLRRIIPARAGFTLANALAGNTVRDHPRSRGVYSHTR